MSNDMTTERNLYKGKYRAMLKLINRTRNQLVQITDHIEDEGDRKYFGNTNHADWLRDLYDDMMSWIWDATDETNRMKSDPYADIRKLRASVAALEEENKRLKEEVAASMNGNRRLPYNREYLGMFVREAWVRWAKTQPNPKQSWLVPYDDLSEPDKEADRQIGEAVARWTLIGDAAARAALEGDKS